MLQNPQWDLTLKSFGEFAESKPTDQPYYYHDVARCACAQFMKALGLRHDQYQKPVERSDLFEPLARVEPHTFGALAKRIKKALEPA